MAIKSITRSSIEGSRPEPTLPSSQKAFEVQEDLLRAILEKMTEQTELLKAMDWKMWMFMKANNLVGEDQPSPN